MKYSLSIPALVGLLSFAGRAAAQQWVQTTSLPDGYAEHSLVYASGFLYQTGGASDSNGEQDGTNVFYVQVLSNGTIGNWKKATPLPEAVFEHAGVTANGFVYVLGGQHYTPANGDVISDVVYYSKINSDGSLGTWQTANPLPQAVYYLSASVWNNTIYVIGGVTDTKVVSSVYSATIQSDGSLSSWVTQTPLPVPTNNSESGIYAQASVANGILYTIGGAIYGGSAIQNNVNIARINAGEPLAGWSQTTPLPQLLSDCGAVAGEGCIYVMGGWNGSSIINNCYSASVGGNGTVTTWVAGPSLPHSILDFGVAVTGSYIFVSGGAGNTENSSNVYSMALLGPPIQPTVILQSLTNQAFQLQLTSTTNTGFGLLASTNLTAWTNIGWGFTDTNGSLLFQDTNAASFPRRYYRAYWPLP